MMTARLTLGIIVPLLMGIIYLNAWAIVDWHEFNKAVIGNRVGKILTHHPFDPIQIILLEIAICAKMIVYQNGHNLTFREPALAVSVAFAIHTLLASKRHLIDLQKMLFWSGTNTLLKSN